MNTPTGVIDLRTGENQKHSPALYMTKICSVGPEKMETPEFNAFLTRVMPPLPMQDYLIRRAGYALTGDTREQMLFDDYGTGANGKTVFQTVLLEILGSYALTAPVEILTESQSERHPTELARLRGARAVWLPETEANRRWNESRVKQLTGGDTVVARFMRQDFFEYQPQFKLFVVGNHLPRLRNTDEAMRRRLQIVHWSVTIPPEERDKELLAKLRKEYPGILYKLIQGCLQWQREGLLPPDSVKATTADYLNNEDSVHNWLEECTINKPGEFCSNEFLFASWQDFCQQQGESCGTQTALTKKLQERGFEKGRGPSGKRGFFGLQLVTAPSVATRAFRGDYNEMGN